MLSLLYTEKLVRKFLESLCAGRYQSIKKAGPPGPALFYILELFNLYRVVDNYLFAFSTMISSASRSCPIMRTQYDFFINCCIWDKPVLMCFGCEENLTTTLDYTTCHFLTTTRTFHTITLLCQIGIWLLL